MRTVPKKFRNVGESLGLEYRFVCGPLWVVWDRHTGIIVHVEEPAGVLTDSRCRRKCRELNGLRDEYDPAINALHDMEP